MTFIVLRYRVISSVISRHFPIEAYLFVASWENLGKGSILPLCTQVAGKGGGG